LSGTSEEELILQLQGGSAMAYRQLLDNHLPSVNRYVVRMMGNSADTEDITQEVFLRLWLKSGDFNPSLAKLSTWLHKIAHNLCIDHFRKHTNEKTESNPDELAGGIEPIGVLVRAREHSNIQMAMQCLPERQRSAIVMCHYQGLSNKEAAIILEISVDALESLLSRGRQKLRNLLQDPKARISP